MHVALAQGAAAPMPPQRPPFPPPRPPPPTAAELAQAAARAASCIAPPPLPPEPNQPDAASVEAIKRQLAAALRYPPAAIAAGDGGQPEVRFTIDRHGHILASSLTRESGSPALDAEVNDALERIDTFKLDIPADQAPEQDRFFLTLRIPFCVLHQSQRDFDLPAETPAGDLWPVDAPLPADWRTSLLAAIGRAWQHPRPMPAQYRLVLHLKVDGDGKLRYAGLATSSGNDALDRSVLEAAALGARLPAQYNPTRQPQEIRLCLAAPSSACADDDSKRAIGSVLGVVAYVPDGTPINNRPVPPPPPPRLVGVGRQLPPDYVQQVNTLVLANVLYPASAQRQGEEGVAKVRVHILRNGTITATRLIQATRFDDLNQEALDVFKRITHLPPVPDQVLSEAGEFEVDLPLTFALH